MSSKCSPTAQDKERILVTIRSSKRKEETVEYTKLVGYKGLTQEDVLAWDTNIFSEAALSVNSKPLQTYHWKYANHYSLSGQVEEYIVLKRTLPPGCLRLTEITILKSKCEQYGLSAYDVNKAIANQAKQPFDTNDD